MQNLFFNQALTHAARLAGKPGRIMKLLAQLAVKLYHIDFAGLRAANLREKVRTLARMTGAYARGHYRSIPWKTVLIVLAAILYFVNPFDLIPDVLPGLGLTDDFTVLVWVYGTAEKEIEKFLIWERSIVSGFPIAY